MAKLTKNQYVLPAPSDIGAATSAHSHTASAVGAAAANDPRLSDARVPNGWVDVVKAGATGNGTTDDTAAIQAAIDGSATGAVIWFPAGTYRVSQTIRLKPSRTYLGAGGRATLSTIKAAPGLTGGAVIAAQGWWDSGSYCDTQIRIEGLQVDGSNVTNVHGLVVFNYWSRVVDVQVVYISGANAAGILCTDLGRNGSTVTQSSHSENQFDACRFDTFTNGASAFKVESFNGYSNMDGDLRDGRFAQIAGYGTLITRAAGWAVVNNHYYGIGYDAIRLERLYATRVVDNYVEGFGDQNQAAPGAPTYGYYQGIMLGQILNGRPSICANNTVSTTQPSSPNGIRFTCFYLEAGASQTRAKVVFEGNAAAFYNDTAPAVPRSWAVDMDVKSGGLLEVQYGDNLIEATSWWQSTRSATASVTIREPAAQVHVHAGGDITSGTVPYARLPVGTSSSTVAAGDDARLSNSRTPTTHAASHASGGPDAVSPSSIGASAVGHIHLTSDVAPSARTVTYANLPGLVPLSNVAVDIVTCTLSGNPTISPAAGTDGQIIRLRMLASGAQRTPSVGTSVRLGTGITDRAMPIPSGQWGVFGLEYIGGLNLWVLFSEYVVSAS